MLRQIEATDTTYDWGKPIDIDIVTNAARYILSDDVFEKDRNNAVAMCLHDLTDDGDSDDSYGKKKKGKKAIRKKKRLISDSESSDEEDERKRKKSRKVRSVMESDSDSEH